MVPGCPKEHFDSHRKLLGAELDGERAMSLCAALDFHPRTGAPWDKSAQGGGTSRSDIGILYVVG